MNMRDMKFTIVDPDEEAKKAKPAQRVVDALGIMIGYFQDAYIDIGGALAVNEAIEAYEEAGALEK